MKKTQSELGVFPNNDNSNEILSIKKNSFFFKFKILGISLELSDKSYTYNYTYVKFHHLNPKILNS
jgi:hypothetical protein